jgi:polar amino acid transport system substrate-binding protein
MTATAKGMMARLTGLVAAIGLAWMALAAPVRAGEVKVTTLDWCPYTCGSAAHGGVTTEVLRQLLAADGDSLAFETVPWQRAVATAQERGYVGYFPEYPGQIDRFTLSKPIGVSPLGLAHIKGRPVSADVAELSKLKVGVVAGYLNGEMIDAAIKDGRIKPDEAKDDVTNLRKLAAGRIDVAVVDKFVMAYLLRHDDSLKPLADQLDFGPVLGELTLHVAFNKSPEAQAAAARLDQRIAALDPMTLQASLFAAMLGM